MNIGFLVDVINERGGARAPIKIAEGLANLGSTITLYSYHDACDTTVLKRLEEKGIKVVFIKAPTKRVGKFLTAYNLVQPLRLGNHDFIACHASHPFFFAAKLAGKPLVYTYYGTQLTRFDTKELTAIGLPPSPMTQLKLDAADQVILALERQRIRLSDKVVGISKSTVRESEEMYGKHIDYLYLGADLDFARKVKPSNTIHKTTDELLITTVSRFVPYKGFHLVIEAYKSLREKHPQARLAILGSINSPEYYDYLKSQVSPGIELIVRPSDELLLEYYEKTDIYTSGTQWEGFGLPFLEAESMGKPVLGFWNTSLPEVVDHNKSGYLAHTQEEFQHYLDTLLTSKALRHSLGTHGIEFAKQFTWEKTAREYHDYYGRFMKEHV